MKNLGMLFGTGLFAVSMAIAAPQDTTQNQGTQDQPQQTTQQPSQAQQGTTTTSQQTTTTQPPAPGQRKLPRTAGEAPLAGLLGLIALGGAAGARILSKRTA